LGRRGGKRGGVCGVSVAVKRWPNASGLHAAARFSFAPARELRQKSLTIFAPSPRGEGTPEVEVDPVADEACRPAHHGGVFRQAIGMGHDRQAPDFAALAKESRNDTVRLKTGFPGCESIESAQK